MATITIVKNKQKGYFIKEFSKWINSKDLSALELSLEERVELFEIIEKMCSEIQLVTFLHDSSHIITDDGLHRIASDLIEEFIKEDSSYVIFDKIEVIDDDHALIVIGDD